MDHGRTEGAGVEAEGGLTGCDLRGGDGDFVGVIAGAGGAKRPGSRSLRWQQRFVVRPGT